MFRQLTAPLAHLRPGVHAKTTQAIDELTADARELKRMAALLAEQQEAFEASTARVANEMREIREQLARVTLRESQLRATLQLEPFPYVIVEDLFPEVFYKALVVGIPPVDLFDNGPVNHQQLAVPF